MVNISTISKILGFRKKDERNESLLELLSNDNPKLKDYKKLIKEQNERYDKNILPYQMNLYNFRSGSTHFWKGLIDTESNTQSKYLSLNLSLIESIRKRLDGNILLDLGGGDCTMKNFSENFHVKNYVNVDYYYQGTDNLSSNPYICLADRLGITSPSMNVYVVKADMLDFVARIKDATVNFTINTIDRAVITDRKYHEALAREMIRATKNGGIIFGDSSDCLDYISEHIWRQNAVSRIPNIEIDKEISEKVKLCYEVRYVKIFERIE